VADGVGEDAGRVAFGHRAHRLPLAGGLVHVVAPERGVVDPLGCLELAREPGRQRDVAHQLPHLLGRRVHDDRHLDGRTIGVAHERTVGFRIVLRVATWSDPRYGFAADAERLGIDSLWAREAWAFDAFTPLAYVAAETSTIRL